MVASGGPKWFVLFGLDPYLSGEFFQRQEQQLITLGSSAMPWRLYQQLIDEILKTPIHVLIAGIAQPNPGSVALHEKMGI